MHYLIFDLETTGLPKFGRYEDYRNTLNYPNILQLSFALCDNEVNILTTGNYYILPVEESISQAAYAINGLSLDKIVTLGGTNRADVFGMFYDTILDTLKLGNLNKCDIICVCHNLQFDLRILQSNIYSSLKKKEVSGIKYSKLSNFLDFLVKNEDKFICTQKMTVDLCKLPFASKEQKNYIVSSGLTVYAEPIVRYKFPKLMELYTILMNDTISKDGNWKPLSEWNLHNSMDDVLMLQLCFRHLITKYNMVKVN